jgi:sulfur relay (sulfurtransferase) DsrC/TusE family protein
MISIPLISDGTLILTVQIETSQSQQTTNTSHDVNKKKAGQRFSQSDVNVAMILAQILLARTMVFYNTKLAAEKVKLKNHLKNFVSRYTVLNSVKTIIKMVQDELPGLLGFEHCAWIGYDQRTKLLQSIMLDE